MSDVACCKNIKCVLFEKRAKYPNDDVPKCRLCGAKQEIVERVDDPVVKRVTLPTWGGTPVAGLKPELLQVAMYAPCTHPGKDWDTTSAVAEIARLYDVQEKDLDTVALRLRLLGDKVLAAEKLLAATDRRVQRVFVVPEWFFRKCIDQDYYSGQYSEDEMKAVVEGLAALSGRAALRDWLIIAGSIRWRRPVTTATRSYTNGSALEGGPVVAELFACENTWLELNTAVVVFGGKVIHCYYKKWNGGDTGGVSTEKVDPKDLGTSAIKRIFATQETVRCPADKLRTALNQLVDVKWHFGIDIDDAVVSGVFTFKTLKIGVEICADADMKALRDDANQTLDLHVVVSCDLEDLVSRAEDCAAIKSKGYLVQCDGNQLTMADHAKKSFKVLRRDGVSYGAVAGKLHGKGVADSLFVVDLPLD